MQKTRLTIKSAVSYESPRIRMLQSIISIWLLYFYLSLFNKPSVMSSIDPPKTEKRWRFYHTFDFFERLKKIVTGSILGADPVLFFASSRVLGGTII